MGRRAVLIPEYMQEVIASRAKAMGVEFDDALVASLDIGTGDVLAQSGGWAVAQMGERVTVVARRMSYSRSAIHQAVRRFRAPRG